MRDTILCLCDLTGILAKPWIEHGYKAVLVDPQHGRDHEDAATTYLARTIDQAWQPIGQLIRSGRLAFVASFPPCTNMAVSGARWWRDKYAADPLFQAKAVQVAEQCRAIGEMSGVPYFVENPIGILSRVFGPPDYRFDPCDYTGYCAGDNYTKRTCLWTGNGFIMPPAHIDPTLGPPDRQRIHNCPPGPERADIRSCTPFGFSRAIYEANHL